MNTNKKDLYIIDLLKKSIATGNPCLDLSYERLGDAGVFFLSRMHDLSHLTQLNLSWNELTDKGIEALAQCSSLTNLTILTLDANKIGDDGLHAIAISKTLGSLKVLTLTKNTIGDSGSVSSYQVHKLKPVVNIGPGTK